MSQSLSKIFLLDPMIFQTVGSFLEADEIESLGKVSVTLGDYATYTLGSRLLMKSLESESKKLLLWHDKIQKIQEKYKSVNLRFLFTPDRFTQHRSYFSSISYETIKHNLHIDPNHYKNLIKKLDEIENFHPDCISLLHSQDISFKLMYDLRKAVYEKKT